MAEQREVTDDERLKAGQMQRMAHAIVDKITEMAGSDDYWVMFGALGAVAGVLAQAHGHPELCIPLLNRVATQIASVDYTKDGRPS